jgi:hypothetical protein
MPRTCTICAHPERPAIESALAAGESKRAIARRFSIGRTPVARHAENCLLPSLAEVQRERERAGAESVADLLDDQYRRVVKVMDTAEERGAYGLVLKATAEARRNAETRSRLTTPRDANKPAVMELLGRLRAESDDDLEPVDESDTA